MTAFLQKLFFAIGLTHIWELTLHVLLVSDVLLLAYALLKIRNRSISADFRLLQEVFDKLRKSYAKNLEHLYVVRFSIAHKDVSSFRDCDPYRC